MADWRTQQVCKTLCRSGKFETGQGTCALICMGELGDARKKGCVQAVRVHHDLAEKILASLVPSSNWKEPSLEERPY